MESILTLAAVFLVSLIDGLEPEMSHFRYVRGNIDLKPDRANVFEMQLRSGIECAYFCSRHGVDTCSIARFLSWNGTCSLFYWKDIHMVRLSIDRMDNDTATLYISPGRKHVYLATVQNVYGFTFGEATTYCALIGGTLGTPTDLTASRDAGWEICACGWMANGAAYFQVSVPIAACGTTNIWRCNPLPAFGAHCLFY